MSSFKGKSLTITNQHQYTTQPFIFQNYKKLEMQQAERKTYSPKHSDLVKSQKHNNCCFAAARPTRSCHSSHYLCLITEMVHLKKNNHSSLL
jgi:hypothetical protein